jgi:hypothetical protein
MKDGKLSFSLEWKFDSSAGWLTVIVVSFTAHVVPKSYTHNIKKPGKLPTVT